MTPNNDGLSLMKSVDAENNSLTALLISGKKRNLQQDDMCESNVTVKGQYQYTNENTNARMRYCHVQCSERRKLTTLDRTFHTTSFLLAEALTANEQNVDIHDCRYNNQNLPDTKTFVAYDDYNKAFADSFRQNTYTSIDLSNMTTTTKNSETERNNPSLLCTIITKYGTVLESLRLQNCQIDDGCIKHLALLLASNSNRLKTLNLSRNQITDSGVQVLLDAMKSQNCVLRELDLSQNCITISGIALFAQSLPTFLHLSILRLSDSEHLLPVSVFQQFAKAIEKSYTIHTLTLGSETMDGTMTESDGSFFSVDKDIEELLRHWWHEPLYIAVADHIRVLLQLNYSGLGKFIQTFSSYDTARDVLPIVRLLDGTKPKHRLGVWFHILRLKPDILLTLASKKADF
jgi:Leucine Rich repeat